MPDTITTNYSFQLPEIGASAATWGTKLNANWNLLDGILFDKAEKLNPTFNATAGSTTISAGSVRIRGLSAFAPTISIIGSGGGEARITSDPLNSSRTLVTELGVGVAGVAPVFYVTGTGAGFFTSSVTAQSYITSSDAALKTDIEQIDGAEALTALRAVGGFRYKRDGAPEIGVIAQRVQQAGLGEAVSVMPNSYLAVSYNALIAVLISAVVALADRVDALEAGS